MAGGPSDSISQLSGSVEKRKAALHFLMAGIGGYTGVYCILERDGVFALAQTLNLINAVIGTQKGNWTEAGLRLGGAGLACMAVVISVLLTKYEEEKRKKFSIAITALAVLGEGIIPVTMPPLPALYPLFFAMTLQWCVFSSTWGYGSSTIFSSNNLRQCVDGYTRYFTERDPAMLKKARFFRNTLAVYHMGAAMCFLAAGIMGNYCIWLCLLGLAAAWKLLFTP